jgi:hypothetical protein
VSRGRVGTETTDSSAEFDELVAWADEIAPSPGDDPSAGAAERLAAARAAIERSGLVTANGDAR